MLKRGKGRFLGKSLKTQSLWNICNANAACKSVTSLAFFPVHFVYVAAIIDVVFWLATCIFPEEFCRSSLTENSHQDADTENILILP